MNLCSFVGGRFCACIRDFEVTQERCTVRNVQPIILMTNIAQRENPIRVNECKQSHKIEVNVRFLLVNKICV